MGQAHKDDPIFSFYYPKFRYLLRKPAFQDHAWHERGWNCWWYEIHDDMVYLKESPEPTHREFLSRWDLAWFPPLFFFRGYADLEPTTVRGWETYLLYALKESPDWRNCFFRPTVICPDSLASANTESVLNLDGLVPMYWNPVRPEGVFMAEALRVTRSERRKRGIMHGKERHRADKTGLYLSIYDAKQEGASFSQMARAWRMKKSTIQSAYGMAHYHIHGEKPSRHKRRQETFSAEVLEKHAIECTICRSAETADEMCHWATAYFNEGYVSQRETPYDPSCLDSLSNTAAPHSL
jgi:hypothetical protein